MPAAHHTGLIRLALAPPSHRRGAAVLSLALTHRRASNSPARRMADEAWPPPTALSTSAAHGPARHALLPRGSPVTSIPTVLLLEPPLLLRR